MAFSELLQRVGNRGRFQIIFGILLVLLNTLMTPHMLVENFSAAVPAHRCYIHLLDNVTLVNNGSVNLTSEALLRVSIPMDPNYKPEKCRRFRQIQWQLLNSSVSITNTSGTETEPCLDGWIYDQSVFTYTIVTKWNLVCDKQSLVMLSQTIFMTGQMIGTPISGYFADRYGRKPMLLYSSLIIGLLGTCSSFAPTFQVYCILRFIMGISLGTVVGNTLVLLVEWNSTKTRTTIMTALSLSVSSGLLLLAALAYVLRDWHILQLAISVPYFVFFLFLWPISESARWLIIAGKLEEALKVLKRVAQFNGKKEVAESLNTEVLRSVMHEELASVKQHQSKIKDIATSSVMCKIICYLCFIRFSAMFFVFSLLLDLQNLGGNMFLTQALLGAIDFPTKSLSYVIMKYTSRRISVASLLLLAGSSVLTNIFVPQAMSLLRLGIALVGKGSIAIYFCISINYNMELTPTQIRSFVQGIFLFTSSLAVAVGSLALLTKQYFAPLPMILGGSLSIMAAICVYFLPETKNLPIPDTIMDVERRWYRNSSYREAQRNDHLEHTHCERNVGLLQ